MSTPAYPRVLVARLDPLRAGYHPWLGTNAGLSPSSVTAGARGRPSLDEVLPAVEALTDPETGVLPRLELDEPPQVPAGLVQCRVGERDICGVGVDTAMARLTAALGAAEHAMSAAGAAVVVGADRVHAEGSLLRRMIHHRHVDLAGDDVAEHHWTCAPQARSWWKAVTLRFGVPARLRVRRLAHDVFHAELRHGAAALGWAVEHTAADAAAFCALGVAGALQWRAAGGDAAGNVHAPDGAMPTRQADGNGPAAQPWQTGSWIWPARLPTYELEFQERMRQTLGDRVSPSTPRSPDSRLARALSEAGFVTLAVAP
jgi:hypothetical protein